MDGSDTGRLGGRLALFVGALLCVLLVLSAVLFVWPPTDRPQHVDAILSLNGPDEAARRAEAIKLAARGLAPVLLFSQGTLPPDLVVELCPQVPGVKVVCFSPVPARTVGEVEFAARYLRNHGLHSVMVVPGRSQALRARLLMSRCFRGRIVVVGGPEALPQIPGGVVYEWGALLKALLVHRGC